MACGDAVLACCEHGGLQARRGAAASSGENHPSIAIPKQIKKGFAKMSLPGAGASGYEHLVPIGAMGGNSVDTMPTMYSPPAFETLNWPAGANE